MLELLLFFWNFIYTFLACWNFRRAERPLDDLTSGFSEDQLCFLKLSFNFFAPIWFVLSFPYSFAVTAAYQNFNISYEYKIDIEDTKSLNNKP